MTSKSGFKIMARQLSTFHLFRSIHPKDLSYEIEFVDQEPREVIKSFTGEDIYE